MEKKLLSSISVFFLGLYFVQTINAAPYGSGTYNSGLYSVTSTPTRTPTPTPTSTPTPTNTPGPSPTPGPSATPTPTTTNSNSSTSTPAQQSASSVCSKQPPSTAPYIFQVDRNNDTATLYFNPSDDPTNNYFVTYGYTSTSDEFSVKFDQSDNSGAVKYIVRNLSVYEDYYFKVRGGNECSSGPWSNTIRTQENAYNRTATISFYPTFIDRMAAFLSSIGNSVTNTVSRIGQNVTSSTSAKAQDKRTVTPNVSKLNPTLKLQNPSLPQVKKEESKQSWWNSFVSFFLSIFN